MAARRPSASATQRATPNDRAWRDTVLHFSTFFSLIDFAARYYGRALWIGGSAVLDGDLPGQFIQFWLYFTMLAGPIRALGEVYNVLRGVREL